MNKENLIILGLFIFLGSFGYILGYFVSYFFDKNETIQNVIHLLTALLMITTFYSFLKVKLFKHFNIEDSHES